MVNPRGKTRIRAEVRLALGLRVDHYWGVAELPEQDNIAFKYWPGNAGLNLLVGIGR